MNLDQSRIGSCPAYGRILSRFVRDRGPVPRRRSRGREPRTGVDASADASRRHDELTRFPASPAGTVTRERRDKVLVVTIDHPPVNALSADVRRGLADALDAAQADAAIRAVLIVGAGRNFIAGADIREFGKPIVPPSLPDVCERIESGTKPVVVALHGATLGGGLEVALAAHYRLAVPGAKLGLPEVTLGLLPGAGGTQRAAPDRCEGRARPDADGPPCERRGSARAWPRRSHRAQRRHAR